MPFRHSAPSRRAIRNPISPSPRQWQDVGKLIRNPTKKRSWLKIGIGAALVFAFTVPIFRSGLKDRLTLFQWLINHTIWGQPVEYIPEEDYQAIFNSQSGLTGSVEENVEEQAPQNQDGVQPIVIAGHSNYE